MPPKLPKRKSKKHAEGCICQNCFAKRGLQKIDPVHVRFSKNDTETENSVPLPNPTKSPLNLLIPHDEYAQKRKNFPFCLPCKSKQLRGELRGSGCAKCTRKWKKSCDRDRAKRAKLIERRNIEQDTTILQKRSEEVDKLVCEVFAMPFYSCPLGYATRKYYGKVGLSRKNGGIISKDNRDLFKERFSELLKIHKGPAGEWLCCRNRVDAAGDRVFLDSYLDVCEWRARVNAVNAAALLLPAKTERQTSPEQPETNSISVKVEKGVSRVLTEEGSETNSISVKMEKGVARVLTQGLQETDETQQIIPIKNIKQEVLDPEEEDPDDNINEDDEVEKEDEAINLEIEESESGVREDEDMQVDIEEPNGACQEDELPGSSNGQPESYESSDNPITVEDCNNPSSSDSDVESIIIPTKRKAPHNIVLDDSDVEKSKRKRIRVPKCSLSINMLELDESDPKPKKVKKVKKEKTKYPPTSAIPTFIYDKPLKLKPVQAKSNSDDSETDPEFIPISGQEVSESESEDYVSVASSSLSEDEEDSSVQIVSDDDEEEERPDDPRINPIVILETVAELTAKSIAKDAAYRAEKQQERDREDFEHELLDKLEFSKCPLTYAIDTISMELGWNEYPYGAKVLNRGRLTPKHIKNPNGDSYLKIKRQFVMRHFKTALSITPCKGQWYCCRNRVDKMKLRFKDFLSRYWNIKA